MNSAKNQRFVPPAQWDSQILQSHPAFAALCQSVPLGDLTDFPSTALLNEWLITRHPMSPWRFVDSELLSADGRYYEVFIAETGQIPTRSANWHDLFGALCWILFPRSKEALNQRHLAEIALSDGKERSALRHQLTLFDECGVLLLCQAPSSAMTDYEDEPQSVLMALRDHQWLQAFWQQAGRWQPQAGLWPLIFGHANYEMLTRPFIGLTGKLWPIVVSEEFMHWPLRQQLDFVDTALSEQIASFTLTAFRTQMSPLPLLGVPGWHTQQQTVDFYQNEQYFRPKRASTAAVKETKTDD